MLVSLVAHGIAFYLVPSQKAGKRSSEPDQFEKPLHCRKGTDEANLFSISPLQVRLASGLAAEVKESMLLLSLFFWGLCSGIR